jgi:hypothetical protein
VRPSPSAWQGQSLRDTRGPSVDRGVYGGLPHLPKEKKASRPERDQGQSLAPGGGAARAAGEGAVTQPPSTRLPGTLQQLEPPLLQEPKAFVPQCQGCPSGRVAGRLPLPDGTQIQPHYPVDFQ